MVRQTLRVSLPLFWFRTSSKSVYQSTKKPNCSFETNKCSNNCLSGRYITDVVDLTENYDSEGYIDFSVEKFGVCHKYEKSILQSVKELEFLGLQINTEEEKLSPSEGKLTHIIQQCQEVYSQTKILV